MGSLRIRPQAAAWLDVSGASEAPKSTVLAVICEIPAPEPTEPYVTLVPVLLWKSGAHTFSTIGATSDDPAPVSLPAANAFALVASATEAVAAATASKTMRRLIR